MGRFCALETGCGKGSPSVRVNLAVSCPDTDRVPTGRRLRDVEFSSGDVVLAGWLAVPVRDEALAGVVLVGGSGPSDRDNGTYFPPIREHLGDAGIAGLSHDKRGVGSSSGD